MRRFTTRRFFAITAVSLMVVGLMLAGCGSGGGSGSGSSQVLNDAAPVAALPAGQVSQVAPDPNSGSVSPATTVATTTSATTTASTTTASTTTASTTTAAASKQLALSWDPVAGATSYNLYWSTVPGVTPANGTKISAISSPSYVHTGLAAGTTYYYVVTAVDSTSESAASASASGSTPL